MAALMLQVPPDTARVLGEIQVPGTPEKGESHITVVYLGKDIPIERIGKMLPVLFEVTSKTLPFTVATTHVTTFPPGDDGTPVIAPIDSDALHTFRKDLCAALDQASLPYDTKFKTYKPHVTLAFDQDPKTTVDFAIPEVTWGAAELVLWGSNRGTGRLVVKFPLSLPIGKTASPKSNDSLYRAAVQLAAWGQRDQFV